jgi:hypothetical protein
VSEVSNSGSAGIQGWRARGRRAARVGHGISLAYPVYAAAATPLASKGSCDPTATQHKGMYHACVLSHTLPPDPLPHLLLQAPRWSQSQAAAAAVAGRG